MVKVLQRLEQVEDKVKNLTEEVVRLKQQSFCRELAIKCEAAFMLELRVEGLVLQTEAGKPVLNWYGEEMCKWATFNEFAGALVSGVLSNEQLYRVQQAFSKIFMFTPGADADALPPSPQKGQPLPEVPDDQKRALIDEIVKLQRILDTLSRYGSSIVDPARPRGAVPPTAEEAEAKVRLEFPGLAEVLAKQNTDSFPSYTMPTCQTFLQFVLVDSRKLV